MAHKLIIKPAAQRDMAEALHWYEEEKVGLGLKLLDSFDQALTRITDNPEYFQKRYRS
jgi:hypothetical protein